MRILSCYVFMFGLALILILAIINQVVKINDPSKDIVEDLSTREPMDIQYLVFNKMEQ